jgi:hypothetical protein
MRLKIIAGVCLLAVLLGVFFFGELSTSPVSLKFDGLSQDGQIAKFRMANHTRRNVAVTRHWLEIDQGAGWTNSFGDELPAYFYVWPKSTEFLDAEEAVTLTAVFPAPLQARWRAAAEYSVMPAYPTGWQKYVEQVSEYFYGRPGTNSQSIYSAEFKR